MCFREMGVGVSRVWSKSIFLLFFYPSLIWFCVASIPWTSLKRKLVTLLGSPLVLNSLHVVIQSISGYFSSILIGISFGGDMSVAGRFGPNSAHLSRSTSTRFVSRLSVRQSTTRRISEVCCKSQSNSHKPQFTWKLVENGRIGSKLAKNCQKMTSKL